MTAVPWRAATQAALYGPEGFFVSGRGGPAAHFRTSAHASPLFAHAVLALARCCGLDAVVDVGAGGGELLSALNVLDPPLSLSGVDLASRPDGLPQEVAWAGELSSLGPVRGSGVLVVANEWLDDVPVDVVEVRNGRPRLVLVDPVTGRESLGDEVIGRDADWLSSWWPLSGLPDGGRAEVGWPRDEAWASVVSWAASCGSRALLVAIDYGHVAEARPPYGSLSAYRSGLQVDPVPDGTCDITSDVALDAVAAAGVAAGAQWSALTTQRAALTALLEPPAGPSYEDARRDPAGALAAMARAGEWAELVAPSGLGGFTWLLQGVALDRPATLERLPVFPA